MKEKEKYLIDVKNAMLWHFDSTEIKNTLEKIDTHFESALSNSISAEEVINEYGKPEIMVNELRGKIISIAKQEEKKSVTKKSLIIAYVLGICAALFLSFSYIFSIKKIAVNVLVIASPTLIWFLSGNNYLIGFLSKTAEKRNDFKKSQAIVFLFALILNLCSLFVVPHMLVAGYINGPKLLYIIYFIIGLLFLMTALYLRKMLQGNLYMFFVVAQNISIILGMFLYISFLYNIESLEYMQFSFTQYFLCLLVLIPYWMYIRKKEKTFSNVSS